MKKIFLAACALCAFGSVNAKSIVEILPAKVSGTELTLKFVVENDGTCTGGQVNFYVPAGSTVGAMVGGDAIDDHRYSVKKITTASLQMAGYDCYQMAVTTASKALLLTDNLGEVTVTLPSVLADGVYKIPMAKNLTTTTGASTNRGNYATCSSYFTVGTVKDGSLALEGTISGSIVDALAAEAGITTLDLKAVTEFTNGFTYVAGRDVVAPTATVSAKVKYVAPAPAKYATLCLPTEAAVDCWVLDRKEGNVAIFKTSTVAPANTPVIIENAVATAAADATITSVAKKSITSGAYLVGEELHTVNGNATIPALRGYWDELAASNCRIAFEGPTGIQMIGTAADIENTYDLQGRQVQNAKNGVYVVNGKKQFVK